VTVVHDLDTAMTALTTIVHEGEGTTTSIWDGDHEEAVPPLPAHFYLFDEILRERLYKDGDKPASGPTGATFVVDWDAAYPMRANPRRQEYEKGHPEIFDKLRAFDAKFLGLLDEVNDAFNGHPERLGRAAAQMYELRYAAVELARIPDPLHPGQTIGPSFGSLPPKTLRFAHWWQHDLRRAARVVRSRARRR
jgi:hypothetical protein